MYIGDDSGSRKWIAPYQTYLLVLITAAPSHLSVYIPPMKPFTHRRHVRHHYGLYGRLGGQYEPQECAAYLVSLLLPVRWPRHTL
jgi:hypothetical protein